MQYFLYRIGLWICVSLPLKAAYKIASFLAVIQYNFCVKDRNSVINNLKIILNTDDEKILKPKARKVFINFAKYLVDFFRFSLVDNKYIEERIEIKGREYIEEAFKKGKGVIAMTAHVGNWELSGVVTSLLGYPVNAIALNHKDKRVNELFIRQRELKGVKVVPLGVAVRRCFSALKNNELIGVVGDRDFTGAGVKVDFLGKEVSIPKGPAMFSLKTGAVIIPTFMLRQTDDTYKLVYQKPVEYTIIGDEEKDIVLFTKKNVTAIENIIREYPEQWFMFREFWKEDANKI